METRRLAHKQGMKLRCCLHANNTHGVEEQHGQKDGSDRKSNYLQQLLSVPFGQGTQSHLAHNANMKPFWQTTQQALRATSGLPYRWLTTLCIVGEPCGYDALQLRTVRSRQVQKEKSSMYSPSADSCDPPYGRHRCKNRRACSHCRRPILRVSDFDFSSG